MSINDTKLKVTQEYNLEYPVPETAFLVPKSDWNRLRNRIERCKPTRPSFQTVAYTLFGISATSLVAGFTLPSDEPIKQIIFWAMSGVFFIGGILSKAFYRYQRRQQKDLLEDILDCMNEIEEQYPQKYNE